MEGLNGEPPGEGYEPFAPMDLVIVVGAAIFFGSVQKGSTLGAQPCSLTLGD